MNACYFAFRHFELCLHGNYYLLINFEKKSKYNPSNCGLYFDCVSLLNDTRSHRGLDSHLAQALLASIINLPAKAITFMKSRTMFH